MAAKKHTRRKFSVQQKREAVEAFIGGQTRASVCEAHKLAPSLLDYWRKQYDAGELGEKLAKSKVRGRANGKHHDEPDAIEARRLTPEALFTSRVNRAIVLLRQAWQEVRRMEAQRKIKGPDKAHSLAYVALLELQGDNGA